MIGFFGPKRRNYLFVVARVGEHAGTTTLRRRRGLPLGPRIRSPLVCTHTRPSLESTVNLIIQLPHATDGGTVRDHADRVIRFALTRFTTAIAAVSLRLVDENGPRGGVDQRCRVQVQLRTGGSLTVEAVGSDPHAVIHDVVARMARTLSRRIARLRERRG